MARDHARIQVASWGDDDWTALPAAAQRLYWLILSQPGLSYAGVVPYLPDRWAKLAPDTKPPAIRKALAVLEQQRFVVTDADYGELLIRTFVKGDNILKFPNVAVAMARAYHQITSPKIRDAFLTDWRDIGATRQERIEAAELMPSRAEAERRLGLRAGRDFARGAA